MWHQLAIPHFLREWKNPECRLLATALALAVFGVTLLSCLTQVLNTLTSQDSAQLLGADIIIEATHPIPKELIVTAQQQGIAHTGLVEFFSMVVAQDKIQLANITAMDNTFPLKGKLLLSTTQDLRQSVSGYPSPGTIWIQDSLQLLLNVKLEQSVRIGNATFIIKGIIHQYPVATSTNNAWSPIAYINQQDVPKMAVLQPGSRANYQLLLAGNDAALSEFTHIAKNKTQPDLKWITPGTGRRGLSETLIQAHRYISLIAILQLFLAAIAIAICAHQYALGQQKKVALWKCLGATSKVIIRSQILFLIILSVPVIVLSVAVAYLLVAILLTFGGSWGLSPGLLSYQGGLLGALSGVGILFGFALAPILGLRKILPVAILQETQPAIHSSNLLSYGLGLLFFVGIIYLFMGDSEIALRLGAIIAIATAALFGVSWILWQFLTPLTKIIPITWRFGLSYLLRHRWQTILQWLVFTLVITLLLVVQIISVDFITQWRQGLSATTPNYFLINIYPEQVSPLQTWFNTEKIPDVQFYPIVRGRMDNARHGIGRPLNLTWMKTLPADNQVIKGQDWSDIHYGQGALSVEEGFAQRQNLQLGDTLTFQIENESVTGKIVQLRSVSWGSFKPNFFVIFAPGNLERFPHTYITSFYLPASQKILIPSIIKNYSEIAVIDIQAILDKIRFMINKIAYALEFLLLLVFILGIVIMYACILFSQKERTIENAILRIVGAQRKFIGKVILTEFLILGTLTGISASVLAALITTDLAHTYFSIPFTFRWHWILMGMLISMTLIPFFGLIGARKVLQIPALKLLRNTY